MKKYVVISSNEVNDYIFYIPLVVWSWAKLGWGTFILLTGNDKLDGFILNTCANISEHWQAFSIPKIGDYKTETLAQCARLYISNLLQDDVFVMVSDCDMLALSDYWKPEFDEITCYGRDLSDEHYPMCYIACNVSKWKEIMNLTGDSVFDIKRDLDNEKEVVWVSDQNIITDRLNKRNDIVRIDRGIDKTTGYPIGRCDRSSFHNSLKQKERIDAHLFRNGWEDGNWNNIIFLLTENFKISKEELSIFNDYRDNFIKHL